MADEKAIEEILSRYRMYEHDDSPAQVVLSGCFRARTLSEIGLIPKGEVVVVVSDALIASGPRVADIDDFRRRSHDVIWPSEQGEVRIKTSGNRLDIAESYAKAREECLAQISTDDLLAEWSRRVGGDKEFITVQVQDDDAAAQTAYTGLLNAGYARETVDPIGDGDLLITLRKPRAVPDFQEFATAVTGSEAAEPREVNGQPVAILRTADLIKDGFSLVSDVLTKDPVANKEAVHLRFERDGGSANG